jgi:hypothetical protein
MSEKGEVRHKQGPKMPSPQAVTSPVDLKVNDGWHPIDDAIKQAGYYVYLRGDPSREEWFWYQTRTYQKGTWRPTGWWRRRFGPAAPANFSPTEYRRTSDGLPPEWRIEPKPAA